MRPQIHHVTAIAQGQAVRTECQSLMANPTTCPLSTCLKHREQRNAGSLSADGEVFLRVISRKLMISTDPARQQSSGRRVGH